MSAQPPAALRTVIDFIRYAASRFERAGLSYGHGQINAVDEASFIVLEALKLPHQLPVHFATAHLLDDERAQIYQLIQARVQTRQPAAYLVGAMVFAQMRFKCDSRALVPRSPIAELIENDFAPYCAETPVSILELCTGSGCIALACAAHLPRATIVATDISSAALALAAENRELHSLEQRVQLIEADLYPPLGERYELIVTNPPYVPAQAVAALPDEYQHEPALGLASGVDGMDLPLRILARAPDYLTDDGQLIIEVGDGWMTLERVLPTLEIEWVSLARGGEGVGVVSRAALDQIKPQVQAELARRGLA